MPVTTRRQQQQQPGEGSEQMLLTTVPTTTSVLSLSVPPKKRGRPPKILSPSLPPLLSAPNDGADNNTSLEQVTSLPLDVLKTPKKRNARGNSSSSLSSVPPKKRGRPLSLPPDTPASSSILPSLSTTIEVAENNTSLEQVTSLTTEVLQTPKKQKASIRGSTSTSRRKIVVVTPERGVKASPKDWQEIYTLVEELRQDKSAPVDLNGSEALPERHRGDKVFRFQVLVSLMLSSQTKDGVVGDTIRILQAHGLDVDSISAMPAEQLNSLIGKVGFHNNKTKYIKQVVEILKTDHDGDIPKTAQEIMKLPGVGPKMAFIVESVAWNTTTGIGIDTHMHRMFNELRWVSSKTPEQTRLQLESWLPRDYWSTVNLLWVGFGQEIQQFKPKLLCKALDCSRPVEALCLLRKLGLDYSKEGEKLGIDEAIRQVLRSEQQLTDL